MSATGEYDHLIITQNFSPGDYLFVQADGDNNDDGLTQPTPDSVYTPEAYITFDDLIDTMGDDILEAMEQKKW